MTLNESNRRSFLASISGALGVLAITDSARAAAPALERQAPGDRVLSHALVLSGGGARGAYEAGLICALAKRGGVVDGHPLIPYGLVCGTSIGALNAWFVATGQYSALRSAWSTLARENILEIKRPYAALMHPHRFVLERLYAALRLASGISSHELGLARSEPILGWMAKHMDPQTPLLLPMAWVATNLTTQSAEYFYRLPPAFLGKIPPRMERALRVTLGENVVIREAPDAIFHKSLLASAAIPIVFDPVVLPMTDGTRAVYADGSIASDALVQIARTVARNIHVVLVDAPSRRSTYTNAIEVAVGGYSTMQRAILAGAMRDVYLQSSAVRSLHSLALTGTIEARTGSAAVRSLVRDLPIADIAYVRPGKALPTGLTAFQEQSQLDETFAIGERDAANGFTPYAWETFRL